MDTLEEPIEPAGSDDVTSSPDTSVAETQPSETSDNVDGGTEGNEGAPQSLILGKYKTQEDLEKAHKELEGKLGSLGQKAAVADLIQEKYGMSPDQLRATIEAEEQQRQQQLYQENPGAFAVQKVQALEQQLAMEKEERELDSFLQKNPEYTPQRDKILKLGLHLEKDKPYEDIAREYFGEVRAQGQKDAYNKIDAKVRTQATGTQSAPAKKFTEADFDSMSAAEMEAILPHADTSYRHY